MRLNERHRAQVPLQARGQNMLLKINLMKRFPVVIISFSGSCCSAFPLWCIQDSTTCMYPKYPQPWIQFKEFCSAREKFIKFSQFAGKTIACLQTLYFLFEVLRARGIKNKKTAGDLLTASARGKGWRKKKILFFVALRPCLCF